MAHHVPGRRHAHAATLIKEAAEKEASLKAFPDCWETLRPVQAQELKATSVVGMTNEEASARIGTGHCEDDEEDYALDIWAGLVPVRTVIREPEDDPRPEHLKDILIG